MAFQGGVFSYEKYGLQRRPAAHGSNEGFAARDFSVCVRLNASCVHACRPVEEVIAVSCVSDSSRAGRVPAAVVRVKFVLLQANPPWKAGLRLHSAFSCHVLYERWTGILRHGIVGGKSTRAL